MTEERRPRDEHQDHAGRFEGIIDGGYKAFYTQGSSEHCDYEHTEGSNGPGLCRRKKAQKEPPHDKDKNHDCFP